MTKDETINMLWERSGHGTRREDIEAAYNAGASMQREKDAKIVIQHSWVETHGEHTRVQQNNVLFDVADAIRANKE